MPFKEQDAGFLPLLCSPWSGNANLESLVLLCPAIWFIQIPPNHQSPSPKTPPGPALTFAWPSQEGKGGPLLLKGKIFPT